MIKGDAMKSISDIDNQAFFLKLVGDYYRYMGESAKGEVLKMARDGALKHYQEAQTAVEGFHACNSIKLGLALNFSVFYHEGMDDIKKACEIAEYALDNAMSTIDDVDEETFLEAKRYIELLKENVANYKCIEEDKTLEDELFSLSERL